VIGRDSGGAILFLLPLAVRGTHFARELTWLGSELCDYNAPLLAPNFSRACPPPRAAVMLRLILERLRQHPRLSYDLIRLVKMPEMVGTQANPMLSLPTMLNPSGAYMAQLGDSWESFYHAKRSSATRRRDRSKRKRLSELGELRFISATTDEDVIRTFDTLMQQKARSFAQMGVPNMFARRGYREFFQAVTTGATGRQLAHVSRFEVGSVIAATNVGLIFHDRYYYLLASYSDGDIARFGPGAAHLHELMRYATERGLRTFDFTIGDEAYKRDWCETRETLHDYISGSTWRGALIAFALRATRGLKRWIKQTPMLWRLASGVRGLVGTVLRRSPR
jgi:CelD/BcsL family acetyltransferase involved in cellulose biosynthesis